MILCGYCKVQGCQYNISVTEIPAPTLENPKSVIYGRINCDYVSFGGKCDGKCSILEQNKISQ